MADEGILCWRRRSGRRRRASGGSSGGGGRRGGGDPGGYARVGTGDTTEEEDEEEEESEHTDSLLCLRRMGYGKVGVRNGNGKVCIVFSLHRSVHVCREFYGRL